MKTKMATTAEQNIVTAGGLKGVDDEPRRILREEFMKKRPDFLYGSEEEWVNRMTPEQRKEYELSLAQKSAMDMIDLNEVVEKLLDQSDDEK